MNTQLVINADDFGASDAVNRAVIRARRDGVLTSASLMVTGDAAGEAVAMAKDCPDLAVGLHLVLSSGRSVLGPDKIPALVNSRSAFASDPAWAALRYYFVPRARKQLHIEIEAQFEAFAETGLPLSHVDGHQHLHAHPVVLPTVIEPAIRHGASGIRVPHDPFWTNMRVDRSKLGYKLLVAVGHAYLARVCRKLLAKSQLEWCEITIGCLMSGMMNARYAMDMLDRANNRRIEIFFHPSEALDTPVPQGPNRGDLDALLDTELKRYINERGYRLASYPDLKRRAKENVLELG